MNSEQKRQFICYQNRFEKMQLTGGKVINPIDFHAFLNEVQQLSLKCHIDDREMNQFLANLTQYANKLEGTGAATPLHSSGNALFFGQHGLTLWQ